MLNSSYDGEIEQWDMIDKYSMNVIYTASVDIRRRMSAKKRSFDFVEFDSSSYFLIILFDRIFCSEKHLII